MGFYRIRHSVRHSKESREPVTNRSSPVARRAFDSVLRDQTEGSYSRVGVHCSRSATTTTPSMRSRSRTRCSPTPAAMVKGLIQRASPSQRLGRCPQSNAPPSPVHLHVPAAGQPQGGAQLAAVARIRDLEPVWIHGHKTGADSRPPVQVCPPDLCCPRGCRRPHGSRTGTTTTRAKLLAVCTKIPEGTAPLSRRC